MCATSISPERRFPQVSEIIRDLDQLPSAPKVIPRLMGLLNDGNSSTVEVSSLIRLDPGIASRVLRLANSIYYGKGVRVDSVEEAVARVGYDQVFEVVSFAAASLVMDHPLAAYAMEAEQVWSMSVACALACEALSIQCGEDRNVAYTTGLLHNVGMVAIDAYATKRGGVPPFEGCSFPLEYVNAERQFLGHTQAEIGAELLVAWDFPRCMTLPVRWQYAPLSCFSHKRMAVILHLAKWIQAMACSTGAPPPLPAPAVLNLVKLDPTALFSLAGEVRIRLLAVRHLLEDL